MGKLRFMLIFDILWAFCCVAIFGDVFLDNSQVKCIKSIEGEELLNNVGKNELSGNSSAQTSYECLKTCLEKWKGAKMAAYNQRRGCFCSDSSFDQLHLDKNITGCIDDGSSSIPQFKIYNMSGFTVRLRFDEYIKQNSKFKIDLEVLLYENGTSTNDSNLLKHVLSPENCEVRIRNSITVVHTWCLGNFNFKSLGKNEICLKKAGNIYGMCRYVTVVAPVFVHEIKFKHGQHGKSLQTQINGSVFNISYAFDDVLIMTYQLFAQFEEKVFRFCFIDWNFKPPSVMLGKTRKFVVKVSNPLSSASRELSFKINFPGLHLIVSHVLSAASDDIKTTVEAKGDDGISSYEDLRYKWYLHSSCKNVTLLTNLTTVAKVTVISNSDILSLLRSSCKISLAPVGIDGSNGREVTEVLYSKNLLTATRCMFAVDFPKDYILLGEKATFGIKKNNYSEIPDHYIWKVNETEMSKNKTFRHIFKELGRHKVSVYGYWPRNSRVTGCLASKDVTVREKLTTLEISVSSVRYFGEPVVMHAVTNVNDYVTYYWNFDDGENSSTSSNTVKHRYYKPGTYTVQLVANNGVSQMETNKTINVIVLCPECEFETSFEDGKEFNQSRSLPVHLEVLTKKLVCLAPVTILFGWTVTKWKDKWTEWRDWEHQKMKSAESIYIPPNVLDYGKYSFTLTVNVSVIDSSVWHLEKFSCVINVIESPLYAIIRGGLSRYVKRNSTFFLDASLSFCPDNLNADLRFSWFFTRGGKTVELKKTAMIMFDTNNIETSAEFKVTVWYGKRKNETTQTVTIEDIKTNMVLDCPSCDLGHLNPSNPTIIMEKCVDNCPSNKEVLWQLLEMRKEYGSPFLKATRCTGSLGAPLPHYLNKIRTILPYTVHYCKDAAMGIQGMTSAHVCRRLTNENPSCPPSKWIHLVFKRNKPHSEMLSISKNYFPGNQIFTVRRKEDEYKDKVAAERFFRVQGRPHEYSCAMKPFKGVELKQDFEITCDVDKKAGLLYKVMYERKKADGSTVSNMFFRRKVPSFKFQLPSGDQVRNSIFISIENENGVARDYCEIYVTVAALKPGQNINNAIEEYLHNRSLTVRDKFSDHPYAYYGQTLYDISLISEVLNRAPSISNSTKLFHLRTQIREILIDILSKITVSSEYVSRQFASSLESCTRVPKELTNTSVAAVVEILYKLTRRERHGNEQGMDLAEDFQTNILNVSSRIINQKSEVKRKDHDAKSLESLTYLFQDILKTKFVRTPLEIINIKKSVFDASLMKYSPYRSENIDLMCGGTRVTIKTKGDKVPRRPYHCDLFGCGLQTVTMDTDPFGDDNTYQKLSPLTKLKIHDCKGIRNCQERVTNMKILFPIRYPKSTWKPVMYNLSSKESHLFTLKWSIPNILHIELVPLGSLPNKLKLILSIRCADERYRSLSDDVSFSTRMDRIEKFFSNFSGTCKELNVMVNIKWEVQPIRYELLRTVVKYNLNVRWFGCLSKKQDNKWSEKFVTSELDNPSGSVLKCRFSKLQSADNSYIAAAKIWPHDFKVIAVESERNGIISIAILAMALFYVVVAVILCFKERQQYENNAAIPLERCDPSHTHKYKITVYTGHCCGAGTTAKVAVVLHGENNSSYPVQLFAENRELFRRNSKDIFVVSVRENLEALKCIHLWHDNSGSSPSWFVDKLMIKDLSTNKKWVFKCCRWLAVDKHDGMLDCKIKPWDFKDNCSFKDFQLAFGENLMDFHIWLSLIRMPTYSLFTRAERLTCCVTLFFAYLFFNAYFCYHYKDSIAIDCLSVFNPTWTQFKVGLFSTLAFLPIYLLFATIFRHTKSFVCLQLPKSGKVVPNNTTTIRKDNIDKPSTFEKCDKLVCEMGRWSEAVRRRKQLELATLLVKTFSEENCYQEDACSEKDAVSRHSPMTMSRNRANTETELSSDSSGLLLHSQKSKLFPFPNCFNVLIWFCCIVTLILSSWYTVEYVSRFDDDSLSCYQQSVFWSLIISIFISQPIQAFIVTVIKMVRRHFILHCSMIDEAGKENEEDVVLDDSMFACFTEKNFEDPLYRKLFCLKYLQPLSRKAVAKARCKLQKRKTTVVFIRDVVVYFLILVLLYIINSCWNQELVFLRNEGLKTFLNRDTNTSTLLTWWSSCPQRFIDTLTFDKESATITAFHNKALVIGNPKMTMTFKYCQDTLHYEMSSSLENESKRHCKRKVERKAIRFDKPQKENWLKLSHSFHEQFNQYVTDVSVQFVIYSMSLDKYSVIELSSHVTMGSRHQNEVIVTTAGFFVNRSLLQTICQLLFTLVPGLLIIRQVNSSSSDNKKQLSDGVKIEYLVVFLSICCVISMWVWIKYQYTVLGVLLEKQHEANIPNDLETMYKYEVIFKFSVAFTLFFVLIKVFHVVILDKFLGRHNETFTIVVTLASFPLFALLLIFVTFAHVGVLLFGDHLKLFGTFWQALSLNVAYLRRTGSENFVVDTPYQQMLLALYVIGFCVCVILFSNLVKAAFCQARINFLLTMKTKRRVPIKVYVFRKIRRLFSLLRSYLEEHEHEEETLKHVPLSYILKELDEQVNDLEFRVTHLTCKENMPNKAAPLTADECSSSDGSDVEYVYKENNERPSFSSFHRDLSSCNGSCFEYPNHENIADSNAECISRQSSSASGSMTTHAETTIGNDSKLARRRPFEQSMRAFPTPINETRTSYAHPQVLLDPFLREDDCAKGGKSTPEFSDHHTLGSAEKESVVDGNVNEDRKVSSLPPRLSWNRYARKSANHAISDHEHSSPVASSKDDRAESNCSKMGGNKRAAMNVNSFTNNAFEGDLEDSYDHIMPSRPKVRLDAFDDEHFEVINDNENCSHISKTPRESVQPSFGTSLDKNCLAENVHTAKNKLDVASNKEPTISAQRPFRQPVFPLTISHMLTRSSEV